MTALGLSSRELPLPRERDELLATAARLRAEVASRIVGQDQVLDEILMALLAGGHALLVGVPGLAKTLMIRSVSEAMRLGFRRIQFTPDLVPSDLVGTRVIVISANASELVAHSAGADAFLSKPFLPSRMWGAVDALVERSEVGQVPVLSAPGDSTAGR